MLLQLCSFELSKFSVQQPALEEPIREVLALSAIAEDDRGLAL